MKNIVLFASGSGSNVQNIAQYFKKSKTVRIALVITNNPKAGVITRCESLELPLLYLSKEGFSQSKMLKSLLAGLSVDLIVLAGFLLKIPKDLVAAYPKKIINIHPALLPKYGGKGMYGMHVHQAVKAHKEKQTGISIHYVNDYYDQGTLIFQAKTNINPTDLPEHIATKVKALEAQYYPAIIDQLLYD